jgi:hypothetical protein
MIPSASLRRSLLGLLFIVAFPTAFGGNAQAQDFQPFRLSATGQIVSETLCSPTQLCQSAVVSGKATPFGAFTGQLSEVIDLTTGRYTGTGIFATTAGDTLNTTYVGRVSQPDSSGRVTFTETHQITGGTGRFAGATGQLLIVGRADAAGRLTIDGLGVLVR